MNILLIGKFTGFVFFFSIIFNYQIKASVFDQVDWQKDRIKRDVTLYTQKDKQASVFFYKAETSTQIPLNVLMENILALEKYDAIFGRIKYFKKTEPIDENNFIAQAEIDFFPYKNRTYSVAFKITHLNDKDQLCYMIEWFPCETSLSYIIFDDVNDKIHKTIKITNIYGRWTLLAGKNNHTYISLEYHNDWQTNLNPYLLHEIEKYIIVNNLKSLIKYCLIRTKN